MARELLITISRASISLKSDVPKMKKLVYVTETFPPDLCGVADYVALVASALANEYEVHIITRKDKDADITTPFQGITVHKILSGKDYIFQAGHLIKILKPDIVDVQLAYSNDSQLHKQNLLTIFNPLILRYFYRNAAFCLTIHELSSYLQDRPSQMRRIYRTLRDYGQTRFYDHYFCVSRSYLSYFKGTPKKSFLPNFSNIPTLRSHNQTYNQSILFFGTIASGKCIDELVRIFHRLYERDSKYHLVFAGGIANEYLSTFEHLLQSLPPDSYTYAGRLTVNELEPWLNQCSYAIYPFIVFDKNASALAMLTNRLIVIAKCIEPPVYASYGSNFYGLPNLTASAIQAIIDETMGKPVVFPDNKDLLAAHVKQRQNVYQKLTSAAP